jgi:hypothetical protein
MTNKFDLSIPMTSQERIRMVLDIECPLDILSTVAEYDTEHDVILAVACNTKVTQAIKDIVLRRTNLSAENLATYIATYDKNISIRKLSETFCSIPWNHVSTNPEGTVRACCQILDLTGYGSSNIIKDDGTTLSSNDNINEHRNAPLWKSLRSQFLKGEKPKLCKLCWNEEKNGIGSHRQRTIKIFPNVAARALEKTEDDGTIQPHDFPIEYWDLRFGNNCNLKCRTCSPVSSNSWYNDYIAMSDEDSLVKNFSPYIKIEKDSNNKSIIIDTYNWYDNSVMWNNIINDLSHIKRFYFTGGEPTINIKHKELLKIIIDKGLAKNIDLDYNTNVAGIPSDMFNLWSNFKSVNLGMSVDGIYEHFEYIRNPGKWSAAERTIRKIDINPSLSNTKAAMSVTVSVMNVLHILDMQWWMKEQDWQRIMPTLTLHNLYVPHEYNIQNLPEEMKFYITKRYIQFMNDITRCYPENYGFIYEVRTHFTSVLNHMNVKSDVNKWNDFVNLSDRLDKIRNENWKISLPELAILDDYYNATKKQRPIIKLQTPDTK